MRLDCFLFQVALMSLAGLGVATEQPQLDGRDLNIDQPQLEARVFTPPSRFGTRPPTGLPTVVNREVEEVDLETRGFFKDLMKKCQKNPKICEAMGLIIKPGKRDIEEVDLETRSFFKDLIKKCQKNPKICEAMGLIIKPGKRDVEEVDPETRSDFNDSRNI